MSTQEVFDVSRGSKSYRFIGNYDNALLDYEHDVTDRSAGESFIDWCLRNLIVLPQKQPAPPESGPYMVSDHGTNTWGAAFYDKEKGAWRAWSPFTPGDGWGDIPDPDKWMSCGDIAEEKVTDFLLNKVLSDLQATKHAGLFEIKDTRIRWSYIASYVDATRVEDLHSTQNEAMMHVINTIGAGAFRLHSAGNSNDRCWFEIEVV